MLIMGNTHLIKPYRHLTIDKLNSLNFYNLYKIIICTASYDFVYSTFRCTLIVIINIRIYLKP